MLSCRAAIPATVRRVHLMGVAGSAMAALGGMLAERGFRVTGSDSQFFEPAASMLRRAGIQIGVGFSPDNLAPPPDLVVVGNVITRANPEAQALLASNIPYVSMPEAIAHFFLPGCRTLMVAGTHGKTTSTAMIAHVLKAAGRDPSMLVGGVARNFESNYYLGTGMDFVIEGDEYDTAFFDKGPKFLHYGPQATIVTALEFDHADIYRDLKQVKAAFGALAAQMDAGQLAVLCANYPAVLEVFAATRARRLTFGLDAGEFRACEIRIGPDGACFAVARDGHPVSRLLRLPIGGRMNVVNALGAYVLLREVGLSDEEIAPGLATFAGVKRRQELIGEAGGVAIIDDFAHHPTAIRATLEAVAERYPGRPILAAFEPRSNTARRNVFQAQFAAAFDRATHVYIGAVYFKENDPIAPEQRLDVGELARAISLRGPRARAFSSTDELLAAMLADCAAEGVAVVMSNGAFDGLPRRILAELQHRARA